eukprot:TRINITY_DN19263_c0_g1_i3.p1 TRINITY_DN19263_c0_g1~~TRINITY_DN19263_c0_g1_i3.p1  ORF type:complete len:158 (-),score=60.63 TRINITY_DN19263_c0_g1_i3:146-619(-)
MAHRLVDINEQQKKELWESFNLLDPEGTGKVAAADIRVVLRALGYDPSKEDVERLVARFDNSKTGALDFSEYMDLLIEKMSEDDCPEDIQLAFRQFDREQTGEIAFDDLKEVVRDLDEELTDEEILEMITYFKAEGDESLTCTKEEFFKLMRKGLPE